MNRNDTINNAIRESIKKSCLIYIVYSKSEDYYAFTEERDLPLEHHEKMIYIVEGDEINLFC
jgi:hypothetical protein